MDDAVLIALIGVVGGLGSAAYSNRLAARSQRLAAELAERDTERRRERTKEEEVALLVRRYRDPFLRTTFDLQSRMQAIVAERFLETYFDDERPDTTEYARENTLFVLAEYLGWGEILRREVRFLDLGVNELNMQWVQRQLAVRAVLQSDHLDPVFQVMHGQQRAIGEVMIVPVEDRSEGGARQETLGYAAFVRRRRDDPDFARWFQRLADDIALLAREPGRHTDRLVALQHALIDVIDFLDPKGERLPKSVRHKLPEAPGAG